MPEEGESRPPKGSLRSASASIKPATAEEHEKEVHRECTEEVRQGSSPEQSKGQLGGAKSIGDNPGEHRASWPRDGESVASTLGDGCEAGDSTEPGSTAPTAAASGPVGDEQLAQAYTD